MNEDTLNWIAGKIGENPNELSVKTLSGGISAEVFEIKTVTERYVMKRYTNEQWISDEPDLVKHEVASLKFVEKSGLPVPRVIAFDETGKESGAPSIIMSKLDGHPVIMPENVRQFVDGLAKTLASIHTLHPFDFPWEYSSYSNLKEATVPNWTSKLDAWEKAIDCMKRPPVDVKERFIHRDYHPANVLWAEGKVSGVVDWVNACRGPAGIDIGHCRVNLALLHGVEIADLFLQTYIRYAKDFTYDPYFDIVTVLDFVDEPLTVYKGWTDLGVEGLTDRLMEERMDLYLESIIS